MNRTDYFLISRNSKIYKARFDLLTSVICFKDQKKKTEDSFNSLSSLVESTYNSFSDTHYTKAEMKSDFCTTESITNLTANTTYALKTLADEKAAQLSSKENLDEWAEQQYLGCYSVLTGEYNRMQEMITWKPGGEHSLEEYLGHIPKADIVNMDDSEYPVNQ